MKKYIISEEEKNRILKMHENATKKQYVITEQMDDSYQIDPQTMDKNNLVLVRQGNKLNKQFVNDKGIANAVSIRDYDYIVTSRDGNLTYACQTTSKPVTCYSNNREINQVVNKTDNIRLVKANLRLD